MDHVKELKLEQVSEGKLRSVSQSVEVLRRECCKDALPPSAKRPWQLVPQWSECVAKEPHSYEPVEELTQMFV